VRDYYWRAARKNDLTFIILLSVIGFAGMIAAILLIGSSVKH
jgi:hypothetical protein